jgi:hypothetical protein
MSEIKKYGCLLSALTEKFNKMDFQDYSPGQVIDKFWCDYNWSGRNINLFDLVLMARGNKALGRNSTLEFNTFLDDFASFMIASHTVHYINRDNGKLGRYLSKQRALDIKEEIRMDFLERLLGINN